MTIVVIMGSVIYLIEGPVNGFADIPSSVYWAVVTMTTVGYGDVVPHTVLGKMIASAIMMVGVAVSAVSVCRLEGKSMRERNWTKGLIP